MKEITGGMIEHGRKEPTLDWGVMEGLPEGMTFEWTSS